MRVDNIRPKSKSSARVHFTQKRLFYDSVREAVAVYFEKTGLPRTGDMRMYRKTAICLTWFLLAYVGLVFFASSLLEVILWVFLLSQGMAVTAFNVSHDAVHGSYSKNKAVNFRLGLTFSLLGYSQMHWRQRHNVLHHTFTNISGLDQDINTFGVIRLSPNDKWHPWHRLQHLYSYIFYSLFTLIWIFHDDVKYFYTRRIDTYKIPEATRDQAIEFYVTKAFYLTYALVIPSLLHPFTNVLLAFLAVHLILGFTLAMIFQLAHTLSENDFPQSINGMVPNEWAIHEVETTANFATDNHFVSWYIGGLNFQIEHHLFARVCHIHYPQLKPIVERKCEEFNLTYTCYPTVSAAIVAHYRFLKLLGRKPTCQLKSDIQNETKA